MSKITIFNNTVKEILEEAFKGLTLEKEKNYVPEESLSSEAYERSPIIYRAHPLPLDGNKVSKIKRKVK